MGTNLYIILIFPNKNKLFFTYSWNIQINYYICSSNPKGKNSSTSSCERFAERLRLAVCRQRSD